MTIIDIDEEEVNNSPSGRMHVCGACGLQSVWGPNWAWYGSWKQQDDGLPVFKACSDKCMAMRGQVEAEKLRGAELKKALKAAEQKVAQLKKQLYAAS